MRRRPYLTTAVLWIILVVAIAVLFRPFGDFFRAPILKTGEAIAQFVAPADVRVTVAQEGERLTVAAGRGETGMKTGAKLRLLDASAALFLATALLTPLGSGARRVLWTALGVLGFIGVMGIVVAGLALVPLVQGGFMTSRIAWRLAALSMNAATSGLIISFPAAIWFISTLPAWRSRFNPPPEALRAQKPAEEKLTRRERRLRERKERKKKG